MAAYVHLLWINHARRLTICQVLFLVSENWERTCFVMMVISDFQLLDDHFYSQSSEICVMPAWHKGNSFSLLDALALNRVFVFMHVYFDWFFFYSFLRIPRKA